MSLSFQKEDEVDREIKEKRRADASPAILGWTAILACYLVGVGLYDWLTDKPLKSYGQEIDWPLTFVFFIVFAMWLCLRSITSSALVQRKSTARCPRLKRS